MMPFFTLSYLSTSFIFFFFGNLGMFLSRKHSIMLLISLELILISVNFNFVYFSVILDDMSGQLYALLLLVVAASESAVALAIIILYYRLRGSIKITLLNFLKG